MSSARKRSEPRKVTKQPQPPRRLQVAALCYKETKVGRKILLITSRDTRRWIVPKGWPMKGKDDHEAALIEAWEEAGVSKADIEEEPMGYFEYAKGLSSGATVPVEAQVYMTRVRDLKQSYPEVDQRTREWFSPDEAAELVDEPDLKAILRTL
jgi:8-oxo-dGTP pyrophosphatase MutT (NUDIX family)